MAAKAAAPRRAVAKPEPAEVAAPPVVERVERATPAAKLAAASGAAASEVALDRVSEQHASERAEPAAPAASQRLAESMPPREPEPVSASPESELEPDVQVARLPLDPPGLFPVQTSWHPKVERREAQLESLFGEARSVREGDLVDGYLVSEITPSSVLFARDGQTVRMRVGAAGR